MVERRSTGLWRTAIPLNDAWLKFATPEQRAAHEALSDWAQAQDDPNESPKLGLLSALATVAGMMHEAYSKKKASADALKAALARRIAAGEFELLGFRIEPTKGREPVVIPNLDFRKYLPDWDRESLEIRDEFYLDLRVSPAQLRRTGVRRGRPGSRDAIRSAIDELRELPNSDFCKISRPQACERVRQLLRSKGIQTDQPGNGLSDKNLSKLIADKCGKRRIKISENK